MAANQALIQGEYAAAPKFVDVQGAFMSGFQPTFEKIQAEQALLKEKEDLLAKDQAVDVRTVNEFNLELVKNPSLKAIGQELRQQALDLINKKGDMDPVEYETQYGAIINKISDLSQSFDKVTKFKAEYQDMQQQIGAGDIQLSKLDDTTNAKYASAIYRNKASFELNNETGELMVLVDGLEPKPLAELKDNRIADIDTFNKYTKSMGDFIENEVVKNGSYISGIDDAITKYVNSNNLPAEKIKGMLVDQYGALISEVEGIEKKDLLKLLIDKTKIAIDEDKQGFAGITTNIEYAQEQADIKSSGTPNKDAVLINSIAGNLINWENTNQYKNVKGWATKTADRFVNGALASELYNYNVQATGLYDDDDNLIGYKLRNPNLGNGFEVSIYKEQTLGEVDAAIKSAIGGNKTGVKEVIARYKPTTPVPADETSAATTNFDQYLVKK